MSDHDQQSQVKTISLTLPNGVRIVAGLYGDEDASQKNECGWSSIDIHIEFPSGHRENLCCADFETKNENPRGYDRLRIMTFKPSKEDPKTISEPLPHRSIWISLDEGTYDVNVWNEDSDDRDSFFEVGHISSLEEAECTMNQIIRDHSFIWTMRDTQMK